VFQAKFVQYFGFVKKMYKWRFGGNGFGCLQTERKMV